MRLDLEDCLILPGVSLGPFFCRAPGMMARCCTDKARSCSGLRAIQCHTCVYAILCSGFGLLCILWMRCDICCRTLLANGFAKEPKMTRSGFRENFALLIQCCAIHSPCDVEEDVHALPGPGESLFHRTSRCDATARWESRLNDVQRKERPLFTWMTEIVLIRFNKMVWTCLDSLEHGCHDTIWNIQSCWALHSKMYGQNRLHI